MSFEKSINLRDHSKIVYNYTETTINNSEVSTQGEYLSCNYINPKPDPNVIYSTDDGISNSYNIKKLYICKLLHKNVVDVTTDNDSITAELIIEMTDNASNKIYSCYFLKTPTYSGGEVTQLDTLLNMVENDVMNEKITLNKDISSQDSCIVYVSKNGSKVFIYTTPITVSKYVKDKIVKYTGAPNLFDLYSNNFIVVPGKNISLMSEDGIYIDCKPTGTGSDNSGEAEYKNLIPVRGFLAEKDAEYKQMKYIIDFCMFIILLAAIYIVVPVIYKNIVIVKLFNLNKCEKTSGNNPTSESCLNRIRTIDFLLSLYLLTLASIFVGLGSTLNNPEIKFFGIFLFVFYAFSWAVIQFSKTDDEFMKGISYKGYKKYIDGSDVGKFAIECFKFFMKTPLFAFIILSLIVIFILAILRTLTGFLSDTATFWSILGVIIGAILPVLSGILVLLIEENAGGAGAAAGAGAGAGGAAGK